MASPILVSTERTSLIFTDVDVVEEIHSNLEYEASLTICL